MSQEDGPPRSSDKDAAEREATAPGVAAETASTEPAPEAVQKKPGKRRSARPPTEREIDSPDIRTLLMLAAIFTVTIGSWGAARFACNIHTPISQPPGARTTVQLASNPKDAAIELQQRWLTYDLVGALELASGDVAQAIQADQEDCEKSPAQCEKKRRKLPDQIETTAVLLRQDARTADARVTSRNADGDEIRFELSLVRDGPIWKVAKRKAL